MALKHTSGTTKTLNDYQTNHGPEASFGDQRHIEGFYENHQASLIPEASYFPRRYFAISNYEKFG
jgi:hypothetical protein